MTQAENQKLSDHFSLDEFTFSDYAIRNGLHNYPGTKQLENLRVLAANLEQVRAILGANPLHISSGFRSDDVNRGCGGAKNSAHLYGFAADFTCPAFGTPEAIIRKVISSGLKYDQIIWEFGRWVHISFDPQMRQQALRTNVANGITHYAPFV